MAKMDLSNVAKQEHGGYTEYNFEKAKNLYDVLLNFSDTMDNRSIEEHPYYPAMYGQLRWIFRGHWDSDWKLLPSAFRHESCEPFHIKAGGYVSPVTLQPDRTARVIAIKDLMSSPPKTVKNIFDRQVETEYLILRQFMETANSLGIDCNYTPFFYDYYLDLQQDRSDYQNNVNKDLENWPDSRILSVMALAQHHGMPTRLLDFTYNSLLAAFFAAKHSFEKQSENIITDEKLCIWAIDEKRNIGITGMRPDNPWRKIPAPTNRSSNLFAQEGLLILDTRANKRFIECGGIWQDLISMEKTDGFVKLTLPQSESKELLRLLWEHNIIPAKIQPNLDRVTKTLEYTKWLWTKE